MAFLAQFGRLAVTYMSATAVALDCVTARMRDFRLGYAAEQRLELGPVPTSP
jgi:hypothetical protein